MKKRAISNLIILEFVVLLSVILIAINLFLLANYPDSGVPYSSAGLDAAKNANLNPMPHLAIIKEDSKPEIKTDSGKRLPKQTSMESLSDLKSPADKVDKELKEKIKKKKSSKEKVKVIIEVKNEGLTQISNLVEESGGVVDEQIGNSIIADVPADTIQTLSNNENIQGLWDDRVYNMLLDTSINQINALSAWNLGYNGSGIKIAVLDTGIDDSNEMLAGKVVAAEVFTGENHTADKQGHGTHIAGIIAGNGLYKGVAPAALLMNAKVLTDSGSGSTSTIIKGISWAVENGADIISLSIGGAYEDSDGPLNAALKDAIDAGVIVVISSGNCGKDCPSSNCGSFRGVTKPADLEEAIAIGAVDKNNEWACFSSGQEFENYIKPDLAAPGVDITSSYLGNNYQALSGTSISVPFVAGVAALMLQKNSSLNQSSLKSLLENNAVDLGVEGKDVKYGSGLVDVSKLFLVEEIEINVTPIINDTKGGSDGNVSLNKSEEDTIKDYEGYWVVVEHHERPACSDNLTSSMHDLSLTYEEFSFLYSHCYEAQASSLGNHSIVSGDISYPYGEPLSEQSPPVIKVKLHSNLTWAEHGSYEPFNRNNTNLTLPSNFEPTATGNGYIDYDDDYTYSTGDGNDGVVWGGAYLDVGVDGEESGLEVICFDWTTDGTLDHCYADSQSDLNKCTSKSTLVSAVCDRGGCGVSGRDFDHIIGTGSSGGRWRQAVDSRYYECSSGFTYYDIPAKYFYVISPRQYKCTDGTSGGTYYDGGYFTSSSLYGFKTGISCSDNNFVCDEDKDDSNADFGSSGTSEPNEPCSLPDGKSDCDNDNQCFAGSYCFCQGACWGDLDADYCCPSGQEWDGSKCAVPCTSHSYKGCSNDDLYWYDSCGNKEEKYDDCQEPASICTSDNGGGRYYDGFCSSSDKQCYYAEFEQCNDCSNGACAHSCDMSSASWSTSSATEGDAVTLTVNGDSDCNGKTSSFNVWELDCGYDYSATADCTDEGVITNPDSKTFVNGKAETIWAVEWQYDGAAGGDPEYYFIANVNGKTIRSSTPELSVNKVEEYCGDNICNQNEDLYSCESDCKPSLEGYKLDPEHPNINKGDSITFKYQIYNPSSNSVKVGLGATVRDTNNKENNDKSNDKAELISSGTSWYSRAFQTNSSYITGDYDAAWGIHKVDSNNKFSGGIDFSDPLFKENAFTILTSCGDGTCNNGENCPKDCLKIDSFYQLPSSVDEDDNVGIKVIIKNIGTVAQTGKVEAAIIPVNFFSQDYQAQGSFVDITGCCEANKYYDTREVTRNAGESQYTTFNITVPAKYSVDECDNDGSKRSAWGSSFIVLAGAYDLCAKDGGTGYYSYLENSITVNPLCSSSQCTSYYWRSCTNKNDFCCTQDDTDNNPNTAYPQYYCEDNLDYTSCSNDWGHTACMKKGSKYCTEENGLWKFRDCTLGCGNGKCLTCNNNSICESGESKQNCPNDCGQAKPSCGMPDGSSSDCDCKSDVECMAYGDYYCNQVSGWDACEPIQYNDKCSNYNDFFCEDNWVKKCVNNSKYWEKQKIESCSGKYQYCDPTVVDGTGKCSKHPENLDVWIDYADTGVDVNKQSGDKLKLNIHSDNTATVKIAYNKNVFDSNDCYTNHIVKPGVNSCNLIVKDGIGNNEEEIKVENKISKINIINNPELLIITDSEKLAQEFNQEPNAVKAVLKQTYANAEKGDGVVYDLSWYKDELGVNNPFASFINYFEKIIKPNMVDNSYSIEVSNFIKEKCNNCKDVMIVGDDFVVPGYRRDISMYEGFLWWKKIKSKSIYTDQAYIKNSFKPLSEIEDLLKEKQDIKIIIDPKLQSSLYGKVEELKDLISSKYPSTVEIIDSNTVACNSFSKLDDATLIIIGGEENNLIRCHPFIPKEDSYLSISPNIWDIGHYSILLNPTPIDTKYDNLLALHNIILNGPDPDWDYDNVIIACLWSGKFGGSVPTAKEITCNMIPLVELAPDIRDSGKCLFANKDKDTDDGVVNAFVCGVVHFATGYDLATWGAAFLTLGATGAGGEVFDGGIAILKVGLKNYLPNIVKTIGRKVVKDSVETIMAAPKLLKGVVELIVRSPKLVVDMIEGSIQILKHGPEVAESAFNTVKGWNFDASKDALNGVGNIKNTNKKFVIFDIASDYGVNTKRVYEFFGDDDVIKATLASRKGFEEEFKQIRIVVGDIPDNPTAFGKFVEENDEIILNINKLADSKDRIKQYTIFHEHGHALKNIVTEGKLAPRLKRLFPDEDLATLGDKLRDFTEFDDTWRMHNFLDPKEAGTYKNALKNFNYGDDFAENAKGWASGGHLNKNILAAKLAETEKFGFNKENQILIDAINNKIGADSPLKTWILEAKDVMAKNAGHVTSDTYDSALINVYNKVSEVI